MKANELMQGDLVYEGDYIVNKVECLDRQEIDGMMEECYSPIPLTPERLEKNGFKEQDKDTTQSWWELDESFFFIVQTRGSFYVALCGTFRPIHYVHELQHALRLCGLNELADNFKV